MITIHSHKTTAIVRQNASIEMLFKLPSSHDIRFGHGFAIHHQVEAERILDVGFKQLHIDLTGRGLIAVNHRGSTFANLNTTHPRTRYILQSEILRQSTHTGCILL